MTSLELWQLYDEQGRPIPGEGDTKDNVFGKALLHGASHVWIWRRTPNGIELLLQRRASTKRTWPGRLDISAAGHIDLGENPLTAALREITEEIGINVDPRDLQCIGSLRTRYVAPDKSFTENEFRFLYLLQATGEMSFALADGEVDGLEWKALRAIKQETAHDANGEDYVPHGHAYFGLLFEALENLPPQ